MRAPQALEYAALAGAAIVVSPAGEIVLARGASPELDLGRVARVAAALVEDDTKTFAFGTTCAHAAPIGRGWTMCVVSTHDVQPAVAADRLRRASRILKMALLDAAPRPGPTPGPDAPPAQDFATMLRPRRVEN
jgi:hypothetical protein